MCFRKKCEKNVKRKQKRRQYIRLSNRYRVVWENQKAYRYFRTSAKGRWGKATNVLCKSSMKVKGEKHKMENNLYEDHQTHIEERKGKETDGVR